MGITQEEFRKTLGHFATGVTVLTVAGRQGQVHGMTANAFTSVSLEPPLVLVCVEHSARTHPLLQTQKRFGVNVLREKQRDVAGYFADITQDHETRVPEGVRYWQTERGTPMLETCLAQLECRVISTYEAGDHTIFLGEVEQVGVGEGQPLLFYRGKFSTLVESS